MTRANVPDDPSDGVLHDRHRGVRPLKVRLARPTPSAMILFVVKRLRGRGWIAAAICMPLLAGCASAGGDRHPGRVASTHMAGSAPTGLVRQARQYVHAATCSAMQLTSPTAIAADIAANAAGDQFGSGSGPSAQADFLPASGKADGNRYAEFACVKSGRRIVLWYDEIGGVWTTMNGGFSISRGLSNSPTRISIPTSSRTQPKLIEGVLQKNFSTAFASSGAPVRPTCSVSDGQSDDYYCVVTNTSTHLSILALYHVDATSGAVFSVKPGNTQSGQSDSSATASGPSTDLYQSCGDTVASFRDITIDLRTYLADRSNVATMHDDFTALSDDLQLMAQQAERQQHDGDVSTLQNAAAAYLADAEEVEISGQLQAPPADFASVLQKACPSSWSSAGLPSKTASTGSNASGSNSTNTGSTGNNGARTRASTHSAAMAIVASADSVVSSSLTRSARIRWDRSATATRRWR